MEGGPAPPLPADSWKASTLAKLASTGSDANARVSLHSSTGCSTCRILGWRNLSSWRTLFRKISVTVSFRFGLCSFSAHLFSNRNTDTSCNAVTRNASCNDANVSQRCVREHSVHTVHCTTQHKNTLSTVRHHLSEMYGAERISGFGYFWILGFLFLTKNPNII